jgi:adenine-specific DNA methylase
MAGVSRGGRDLTFSKGKGSMIEKLFDVPFVADMALREKQIQQNYRPPIAVHKWFARRPGTLFRGLVLSEFVDKPLRESFYESNDLSGRCIADPFMGGGTPLMEANRVGCDVIGFDINPMAYWIVRQEIEHLDLSEYRDTAKRLRSDLEAKVGHLYRTRCLLCGRTDAHVKYFLWVKTATCGACGTDVRLFPGYLVAEDRRHPKNVFLCPRCDHLTEITDRKAPGCCGNCGAPLRLDGPAGRGSCPCPSCATPVRFPNAAKGPPRHVLFAMEYHCPSCLLSHSGRFFKAPDEADRKIVVEAEATWSRLTPCFVPDVEIPSGDETDRLHRWGYRRYGEMFSTRQLLGLEESCRLISRVRNTRVRNALATNLSDLLRYQNMLCRYDTMALKSLDIFSVHGFPVGLIQCESNLLGIPRGEGEGSVGSGGWFNITEKFAKAKAYCDQPFEFRHNGMRKDRVDIPSEWIGDEQNGRRQKNCRTVKIVCADAAQASIPAASLDAVFTDPPYFGNVQYAELMDFCYVWLRRLVGDTSDNTAFDLPSTRNAGELTGNANMGRGIEHFTDGISAVFQRMAVALKPGRPLAFTYHHNDIAAYYPLAVGILDSKLTCSASIPCPAEMGASIHISGTASSIIDTVFVCRSTGSVPRTLISLLPVDIARMVRDDLERLTRGGVKPTAGDIRCVCYGHIIRLAVWYLRASWKIGDPLEKRLAAVSGWIDREMGGVAAALDALRDEFSKYPRLQPCVREETNIYADDTDAVAF